MMVRSLEDILASISATDSVEVSYLQLYMESIQDLLAPEKTNIPIVEDAKTGEVSVPGIEIIKIRNLDHFLQILQLGESNRHAANTKMNTESSRSHAILTVYIRRSGNEKEETEASNGNHVPTVRKSKLLIVDLAGSERVNKSGSEGHLLEEAKFINLSLSSLGKCINALAENSPHIPIRDSKLTRLLRDSFGGSARTSLIITIGPSSRHHAETASTVMFGQRAMKVVNTVKLKEEFDYESLCKKLESQVDRLSAEIDRQQKLRENERGELNKLLDAFENSSAEAEKRFLAKSESLEEENARLESELNDVIKELQNQKDQNIIMHDEVKRMEMNSKHIKQQKQDNSAYQNVLAETTQMYEGKIADLMKQISDIQVSLERARTGEIEEVNSTKELLKEYQNSVQVNAKKEINELQMTLQEMNQLHETTANELRLLSVEFKNLESEKATLENELHYVKQSLEKEEKRRKESETELLNVMKGVPESEEDFEEKVSYMHEHLTKKFSSLQNPNNSNRTRETILSQRNTITKICEEGKILPFFLGLQKILSLLESGDLDVQIPAVKVVANLAAEDSNQEKIVNEGGLDALLMLVESSNNTTILRVASGAIANLAMNAMNQGLITNKGGAKLLASASSKTDDPQTLRMIAGAIANLCGNGKLHVILKEDGAIKALLRMTRLENTDVIAQVARGLANFAKCESRRFMQGHWRSRSLLMDDGALSWLVANLNTTSTSTRRHLELAICHLAQNEENGRDFISSGALKELIEISEGSAKEDIRNLAKKTLRLSPLFRKELRSE
ncbi:hypothetical protein MIMGU_mgv1a001575mg [Erythranthe guttata]|uniref:Kinesin-like protein n=1 Tax=Erythranthe guttata TaxID=4155 RepID=A0A022RGV5_ERYGU|nr:hypothetical protein MIMGU_mgv1a001575mg [Erythranthe guttata]